MADLTPRETLAVQLFPERRQELWTETNTAYSIARYGTPTG